MSIPSAYQTALINNEVNLANTFPHILQILADSAIEYKNNSSVVQPLRELGFIPKSNMVPREAGPESVEYVLRTNATDARMTEGAIRTNTERQLFDNGSLDKILVKAYRGYTHSSPFTLEDVDRITTVDIASRTMQLFEDIIRAAMASHHSLLHYSQDDKMLEVLSGKAEFTVNTTDGTVGGSNTIKKFGLPQRLLDRVKKSMTLETIQQINQTFSALNIFKAGMPGIGLAGMEVYNTFQAQVRGMGSGSSFYSSNVRIISNSDDDIARRFQAQERIQVGNMYIIPLKTHQEIHAMQVDTTTPSNSKLGMIILTPKALGGMEVLMTDKERNMTKMRFGEKQNSYGYSSPNGFFNVNTFVEDAANKYLTYNVFEVHSAYTIIPDRFDHAGLFVFDSAVPALNAAGETVAPIDFTDQMASIVTRATQERTNALTAKIV